MSQSILRTQKRANFRIRIQGYIVATLIPPGHSIQHSLSVRNSIYIVGRIHYSLGHSFHDPLGRRNIRRTDTQVNDIFTGSHTLLAHFCQSGEYPFSKLFHSFCKFHYYHPKILAKRKGRTEIRPLHYLIII